MQVLLTGSSGWLGRFLGPLLRRAGHDVTGLDVAPGADTDIVGSVADRALIDRVFAERGIEAVIHGAALHKPDIIRYPAQRFVDVNVTGTLNLLEAAVAAGGGVWEMEEFRMKSQAGSSFPSRSCSLMKRKWLTPGTYSICREPLQEIGSKARAARP